MTDLAAVGKAFCLFALFAFVPGYVLGWALDILRFRRRSIVARVILSTPLSIALCPIITFLLSRFLSMVGVWLAYAVLWTVFAALLLAGCAKAASAATPLSRGSARSLAPFLALAAGWIVLGTVLLVDIQIGDRLYMPIASFDYSIRTAFTNAISTTGIPPQNPLFTSGQPAALRYHYFWLMLCSLVNRLGGSAIGPRQALIAGTLWCGIGMMACIALFLRLFDPGNRRDLRRRVLIGIALLGVTGLDIVPTGLMLLVHGKAGVFKSVEFWNEQVDGWLFTVLWQPHNVAGLVACLTGFLILWQAPALNKWSGYLLAGVASGAAFATAVGTSIYIAFVFAVFLCVWMLITVVKKWYRETAVLAIAGVTAVLLSITYLRDLSGPATGGAFLQLTVRTFTPVIFYLKLLGLSGRWRNAILNGLCLPLNYFLEFGFFFVIGLLQWRRYRREGKRLTRQDFAGLSMFGASLVVCTFLRSGVISNNDLGWRGFMIAQFILLIWGANFLADRSSQALSRKQQSFITVLLVLGAVGTVYDVVLQRTYLVLADAGRVTPVPWLPLGLDAGKRAYAERKAYEWIQGRTTDAAVIQQNPDVSGQDTLYLAYGNRRTVAADITCGTGFGGDSRVCESIVTSVKDLFSAGADQATAEAVCERLGIDVLVAKNTDKSWSDRHSWVWTGKPAFANDYVRVFPATSARASKRLSRDSD